MSRLNADARYSLQRAGVTVTEYAAQFWDDSKWRGSACGCPDDRCAGTHHDTDATCQCVTALLRELTLTT